MPGPANDAVHFARWLTDRGVPAANIRLLISTVPEREIAIAELAAPLTVEHADQATIRDLLVGHLSQTTSDLLVVYWGGHGVVDNVEGRRLFYTDAVDHDPRNLNLTSLLLSLRSSAYPGHSRQLVLVDACLNPVRDLNWATALPDERFPVGDIVPGREQMCLFAASVGQVASNDSVGRTGLFSRVVREALDAQQRGAWPPDPVALRDFVTKRFERLRATGHTNQTPSYLWYGSPTGEETLVYATPERGWPLTTKTAECELISYPRYEELRHILDGAPAPTSLRALYREAARDVVGLPHRPDDLMSSVDALRRAVNARPLFEFLVRLAAGADSVTRRRLWDWMRAAAAECGVDLDALTGLDHRLRRTFFLLRWEPDPIDAGFQATAWMYTGSECRQVAAADEPWDRHRLSVELSRLLDGFEPGLRVPPVVEFLLPVELLDVDLDALPVLVNGAVRELGGVCPVHVRPLDRVEDGARQANWQRLTGEYQETAIGWVSDAGSDPAVLRDRVCAAFAYARDAGQDTMLFAALGFGTPIMLWHRARSPRHSRRDALERILRGRALRDLPDVVLGQRIAARHPDAAADHPGRDLVLLWDDPNRVAPTVRWQPPRGVAR